MDKVDRVSRVRAVHAVPLELEQWEIPRSMRAECCSALARILPLLPILWRENPSVSFHGMAALCWLEDVDSMCGEIVASVLVSGKNKCAR